MTIVGGGAMRSEEEDGGEDAPRVFKTEGDEGREGDVIRDDKKDITVLADQEEKRPAGAPWNPALGPSTSGAAQPAKPLPFRPASSAAQGAPMSVFVPNGIPSGLPTTPNFAFFPMAAQWGQGQGLSWPGGPPPAHAGSPSFGGAGLSPLAGGFAHSPSYEALLNPAALHMAQLAAASRSAFHQSPGGLHLAGHTAAPASPQTNFSPLPSPTTGTPIQLAQPKTPQEQTQQFLLGQMMAFQNLQQYKAAAAANFGAGVPLGASLAQRTAALKASNPILSLSGLTVPSVPHSVTSLATSLAEAAAHREPRSHKKEPKERVHRERPPKDDREPHVKKPLNAFMLFMKANRAKMQEEKGFKERQSAELNKEMGKIWHSLSQEEQQKYYQMAKEERTKHAQQYPNWSARDNYAVHKKKKRKRDRTQIDPESLEAKKCRARYGLERQDQWCKHCKRKKKCLWYHDTPGQPHSAGQRPDPHSPVHVSSTTQGSPPDSEASTSSSLPMAAPLPSAAALPPGLSFSAAASLLGPSGGLLASPSSLVSSTTKKAPADLTSDDDDDSDDEEDDSDLDDPASPNAKAPRRDTTTPTFFTNNNKPPPLPPAQPSLATPPPP